MKNFINDLFFKREIPGEPVDYPTPGQPRVMRSVTASNKKIDFNSWAIHIHKTVRNNKFKK